MSASLFTLCCGFCILITTNAMPSTHLFKDSVQNAGYPQGQAVAYNFPRAEPSHSMSSATFSIHASVNNDTASLRANPVCIPPPRFNPVPIPPQGGCAVAILNMLNEVPEDRRKEPIWWPQGISQRNWTFMGCRVTLYSKHPGSGDMFSYLDIAYAASRLLAACNTKEHGYRGGYTELDSQTRVFDVALYGVPLPRDVES